MRTGSKPANDGQQTVPWQRKHVSWQKNAATAAFENSVPLLHKLRAGVPMGAKTLGYSREEGSSRSGIGKSVGFSLEKTHVSSVTNFVPTLPRMSRRYAITKVLARSRVCLVRNSDPTAEGGSGNRKVPRCVHDPTDGKQSQRCPSNVASGKTLPLGGNVIAVPVPCTSQVKF